MELILDELTYLKLPKDIVILKGDSITIEYKGFDLGRLGLMKRKTLGHLSKESIKDTIKIGMEVLNCRDKK
jgi:hypothetical protein|tara:strand:- start:69 stop:281 length:213 start_codon:yes stop_codon:yes gene_type:complete